MSGAVRLNGNSRTKAKAQFGSELHAAMVTVNEYYQLLLTLHTSWLHRSDVFTFQYNMYTTPLCLLLVTAKQGNKD